MSPPATRVAHEELLDVVRGAMSASGAGERRLRMGMEMGFVPVRADGGARVPLEDAGGGPSGTQLLRRAARGTTWREESSRLGVPWFRVPGVGVITFEPGGQVELATDAFDGVEPVVTAARQVLRSLLAAGEELGIDLVARGLDPGNRADDAELVVPTERLRKQQAHYARIGPWGRRMLLQSAAIHVNLDLGGRPVRRWWTANKMAPYLTAIFANSPMMEGEPSGFRSSRAEQWRHLDPSRTGAFGQTTDPVAAYARFALDAADFLTPAEGEPAGTFRQHWEAGAGLDAWRAHLTTLFPEVRPRGYLELRSFDALPPWWMAVPLVVTAGVLYAPGVLDEAARLLPDPTPELLLAAGRAGLGDAGIRGVAGELFDLALEGAATLGEDAVGGSALDEARAFRDRFVRQGEDPGHESHVRSGATGSGPEREGPSGRT